MKAAPYPPDVKAKGWRFELDVEQVMQSDTWALAPAEVRPWLLMLWAVAWQQHPCGSMPADDQLICARLGMPADLYASHKQILLRGWEAADDGRLYHSVVTQRVLDMLARRVAEKQRKQAYRQRMEAARETAHLSSNVTQLSHGTDTGRTRESQWTDATRTRTSTGLKKEETSPSLRSGEESLRLPEGNLTDVPPADSIPPCPQKELIELYHAKLPMLPKVRVWNEANAAALRARWRWVLTSKRADGSPRAGDAAQGLAWFGEYFDRVAASDFLTQRMRGCDLAWLVKAENFRKVMQGNYTNQECLQH